MGRRLKAASYSPARNPNLAVLRCSDGPRGGVEGDRCGGVRDKLQLRGRGWASRSLIGGPGGRPSTMHQLRAEFYYYHLKDNWTEAKTG